ncbi:MAG: hypothetical protein HY791_37705 [Deltaproteobacteria bacterium]|nr:hypothetical protein [Deltaproteobacteria bacterium]
MPSGGDGSRSTAVGLEILDSDPNVEEAGVDPGYEISEQLVRAPGIGVGNVPNRRGWISGVPRLAVEYSSVGQDEEKLEDKIQDFLSAGTEWVWVVRLLGPRRVEVYDKNGWRAFTPGQVITAPGVLKNPVPVEAFFDRDTAHEVTLANLLQRRGYENLGAVLEEGREEGQREGQRAALREAVTRVLRARGLEVTETQRAKLLAESEVARLERWLEASAVSSSAEQALSEE